MRKLLVALHDVTPAHAARLEKAERLFTSLGLPRVTYLFVPRFHGGDPAHLSRAFVDWCRADRSFDVQWFLHGYFHDERADAAVPAPRRSLVEWAGSSIVTAQEAEFLRLRGAPLRVRLCAGMQSFECCLEAPPEGFVAPGWLFNDELVEALARLKFRFTESPFRVIHVSRRRELRSPMITWATRTALRRYGSQAVAAVRCRTVSQRPVVRVAIHPHDLDDDRTVDSIARSLDMLRRDRVVAGYDDSLFDGLATAGL